MHLTLKIYQKEGILSRFITLYITIFYILKETLIKSIPALLVSVCLFNPLSVEAWPPDDFTGAVEEAMSVPYLYRFNKEKMKQSFRTLLTCNRVGTGNWLIERAEAHNIATRNETIKTLNEGLLNFPRENMPGALRKMGIELIRGDADNAVSDFNCLITMLKYFGDLLRDDGQQIDNALRSRLIEQLVKEATFLYHKKLPNNPMSLKNSLITKFMNQGVLEILIVLIDSFRISNLNTKYEADIFRISNLNTKYEADSFRISNLNTKYEADSLLEANDNWKFPSSLIFLYCCKFFSKI